MRESSTAVVIGAGGGLGKALCRQRQQCDDTGHVIAISRQPAAGNEQGTDRNRHFIRCGYSQPFIESACSQIQALGGPVT